MSSTGSRSASTVISDVFVLKTGIVVWSNAGREPERLHELRPAVDTRGGAAAVAALGDDLDRERACPPGRACP